jgi:hypothetical protein
LIGCAKNKELLDEAGTTIGTSNARVTLPEYPTECTRQYPHIKVREGYEAIVAIKNGNRTIDKGNLDKVNCTSWYRELSAEISGRGAAPTIVPPR